VNLVLNATSLGLKPDDSLPLEKSAFALKNSDAVCRHDLSPRETMLLRASRLAGCRVANGLGMLLHQARARWKSGADKRARCCDAPRAGRKCLCRK